MTDTLQQLREIPDLAVEAYLTWDAKNPGEISEKTGKPRQGSKPPTDLAVLDALRPDPDVQGKSLRGKLGLAIRAVWEDGRDQPVTLPDLADEPTFASECDWLLKTVGFWSGDTFLRQFVTDQVAEAHSELSRLCRVRHEPAYECRQCGDVMRVQPGGEWMLCDSGHQESTDLERKWRFHPAMTAQELEAEFRVPASTLTTWVSRRKLKPANRGERVHRYYPWDVLLLRYPIIRDALAEREKKAG